MKTPPESAPEPPGDPQDLPDDVRSHRKPPQTANSRSQITNCDAQTMNSGVQTRYCDVQTTDFIVQPINPIGKTQI